MIHLESAEHQTIIKAYCANYLELEYSQFLLYICLFIAQYKIEVKQKREENYIEISFRDSLIHQTNIFTYQRRARIGH